MKNKVLAVLGLAAVVGFGACKGSTNTNTVMNTNTMVVSTPSPVTKTTETAMTDPNLKSKIEGALKAKGFTDVTVDTATTPATLRGTVAKGKMAEVMATAMEANGGKPVTNQVQEK
ncbi:MAG: hypothetical protein LH472_10800 [Pyrinomonadaceae bacterium]|nr:hypothetical protein [Pyrinomonadaceae bacterium]